MRFQFSFSQPDIQTDFDTSRSNTDLSPSISNDQGYDQLSRSQFCKEQQSDPEISPLFDRARDGVIIICNHEYL